MQNQAYLAKSMFAGGQLIVMPRMSRARFFEWVKKYEIDYAWYVDVMHTTPAKEEDRENTLAFVPSAGIHGELHRLAEARFDVPIRDSYASTELGPGLGVPIDRGDLMERPGAIGFPTPFREAKIVDSELRDVAPGTRGELLVRGPGIFLGYHNDPEATAENIVDGWFRTGDLCSTSDDGCFYIHGRIKESINRSGENIASEEVAAVLRGVPYVDEVAVVGVPDDDRGEEVKAYLVVAPGFEGEVPPEAVFAVCEKELAPFKVPRYLEYRTDLPMTASGKVATATLVDEKEDLRVDSYDRIEGVWHTAT
jgi:crotonobetaine/carnitine-CoA ligase